MKKNPIIRFFVTLTVFYLLVGVVSRSVLWYLYARDADTAVSLPKLLGILPVGMLNDLIALLPFLLFFFIVLAFFPVRCRKWRISSWCWGVLVFLFVYLVVFISAAEIAFFDEFAARFNLVAVSYLLYPTEVIGNIRESYPLPVLLPIIGLVALAVLLPFRRRLVVEPPLADTDRGGRRYGAAALVTLVAISLTFIGPKTIYHSQNRIADELAANGVTSFFSALHNMHMDFNTYYKTGPIAQVAPAVRAQLTLDGSTFASQDLRDLNRVHSEGRPLNPNKKLNIVVFGQESLGAEFVESLGGKKGLTPFLDSFGKQSLSFVNAFATGTRTVRGLEAIASSFPPIPSESIIKQPEGAGVTTIGSILRKEGYSTSFLYGGYGIFDSMNQFFSSCGFEISDRNDIENVKFSNIWGVSDEDLFRHAIGYFRKKSMSGMPFFGLVMSTSNHKPYTFPPNDVGIPEAHGGREAGIRYADYALRKFFEEVKDEPWFDDTIFVVIADHDARVYGKTEIPLMRYRIPVYFYAPKYITPQINEALFSQLDVTPTLLGMLGVSYTAPFYGQNVLSDEYQANADRRWVPVNYNFDIGLYNLHRLLMLGLNKEAQARTCVPLSAGRQSEIGQSKTPFLPGEEDLLEGYFQLAYNAFKERRF